MFEKHIANFYGQWRVHGKVTADWMPKKEPGRLTEVKKKSTPNIRTQKTYGSLIFSCSLYLLHLRKTLKRNPLRKSRLPKPSSSCGKSSEGMKKKSPQKRRLLCWTGLVGSLKENSNISSRIVKDLVTKHEFAQIGELKKSNQSSLPVPLPEALIHSAFSGRF